MKHNTVKRAVAWSIIYALMPLTRVVAWALDVVEVQP